MQPGNVRWEHRTVHTRFMDTSEETTAVINQVMHDLEVLGWELVSVATGKNGYRLFFKRQALDNDE